MELRDIQRIQREFDEEYFQEFWKIEDYEDFLDRLEYLVVALTGEVGEFANIVKKMRREYMHLSNKRSDYMDKLREELVDIFIYTVITANLLDMDIEEEFLKKLEYNRRRFKKYREAGDDT